MVAQNFKSLCAKVLDFYQILKMHEKILLNPRIFSFCFILYKEKMLDSVDTDSMIYYVS